MFSKKFSLEAAYSQAAKIVLAHFMFFVVSMIVGGLAVALAFAFLGYVDLYALRNVDLSRLIQIFHHVVTSPTGVLHYGTTTIYDSVSSTISPHVAQQVVGQSVASFDLASTDVKAVISVLAPTMIALKLFLDMIAIGWVKIALSFNANQTASLKYLFEYYYLVPRVFVVNLIVGVLTIAGTMLFIVPGIFVYQRLRFARFFVIDKNLGIVKALQASWAMTEEAVLELFGFSVLTSLLRMLSVSLAVLWVFVSPLTVQAEVNVYKQMLK